MDLTIGGTRIVGGREGSRSGSREIRVRCNIRYWSTKGVQGI